MADPGSRVPARASAAPLSAASRSSGGGPSRTAPARSRTIAREPSTHFPIALKYALVTGVLLVGAIVFTAQRTHRISVTELDREIHRKGVSTALLLAEETQPFWIDDDLVEREQAEAQQSLAATLATHVRELAPHGVLDVLVLDETGRQFVAVGSERQSLRLDSERSVSVPTAERAGVDVIRGRLDGQPARSYRCAIRVTDTNGERTAGYVQVFLSAVEIDELKRELESRTLTSIILALLVVLPLAAIAGGVLTRPVRVLKRDMAHVAAGDLDHQSQVHSGDELELLAHAFNRMTAHLAEARDREVTQKALERELAIATQIQSSLLPREVPPIAGFEIAPHYQSAKEVGGDYYDIIERPDGRIGIIVADVSGKGVPASLVMTMTRSLVRMASRDAATPEELLARVNRSLSRDMSRGMFVTAILAELDPATGDVSIVRAGHNPGFHVRTDTARTDVIVLQPPGMALGMVGAMFERATRSASIQLAPGEALVLYTDGIIEAMSRTAEEYSSERLVEVLRTSASRDAAGVVSAVLADVGRHTKGAVPSDDITLVDLPRLPR